MLLRQVLMNEEYGQLQIDPSSRAMQAANVIRQHANVAAAFEPTVPSFYHTTFAQQGLALRHSQQSIRPVAARLSATPSVRLGPAEIQRGDQTRAQAASDQLMQRPACNA